MKTTLFFLVLLTASLRAGYDIVDPVSGGYTVKAETMLSITSPDGTVFQLTPTFLTDDYSMPPTSPVVCSWSPDGRFVAVFYQQRRITELRVFDTKENKMLVEDDADPPFPGWYNASGVVYSTTSIPGKWSSNGLSVTTTVLWRDKSVPARQMLQILTIGADGIFALRPIILNH